jgi:hypothetical protein
MTTPLGLTPIERKYAFAPAIVEKSAWRKRAARCAAAMLAALRVVLTEGAFEPAAPEPPAVRAHIAAMAVKTAADLIRWIIHLTLSNSSTAFDVVNATACVPTPTVRPAPSRS